MTDLCFSGARKLARLIRGRRLSATELMRAYIAQIERVNPQVNAIVTFLPEQALAQAKALDRRLAKPRTAALGPLAGLPIAYKDLVSTRGIRTTRGSPIYADHVPDADAALVERLAAAGAITLGKTNTPEFGAGSQTFNAVFGATRNPYDLTKTCGGSSGGAAVALACGMLPFADGSDLGGSLRNPANFCNVVGFRPTPGRVPGYPADDAWDTMSVLGPMARSVEDTAFLLAAMAGPDPRAPVTLDEPGRVFARALKRDFRKVRVAWSPDLGGLPIDRRIRQVLDAQRRTFEALGCIVEDATPDLEGADEVFHVLRAVAFATKYAPLLDKHRHQMKDTVIWNIEAGLALDAGRIARAHALRSKLYQALRTFMQRYEFLHCAGLAGAAVPGRSALCHRDQRREAHHLHRLDEGLLPHHQRQPPGDLGARGIHRRRSTVAGGRADRGPLPRRFRRAAACAGLRVGHRLRQAPPRDRRLRRGVALAPTRCGGSKHEPLPSAPRRMLVGQRRADDARVVQQLRRNDLHRFRDAQARKELLGPATHAAADDDQVGPEVALQRAAGSRRLGATTSSRTAAPACAPAPRHALRLPRRPARDGRARCSAPGGR